MQDAQKILGENARFITGLKKTSQAKDRLTRYLEWIAAIDKKHHPDELPAHLRKASAKEIAESYLARLSQPFDNLAAKVALELDRACFAKWWHDEKKRMNKETSLKGVQAKISTQPTEKVVKRFAALIRKNRPENADAGGFRSQ